MKFIVVLFLFFILAVNSYCQPTVGLTQQGVGDQPGYVLFAPLAYNKTYLIDKCGYMVHSWTSNYLPGNSVYFLPDGNLLRPGNTQNFSFPGGGRGGIIEKIDWNNNVIWSFLISNSQQLQHSDICPLPNGNILVIAWEAKGNAAAISAGRNPAMLGTDIWGEKIMEIQPTGNNTANIVWEWHTWDHLVQEYDSSKTNYGSVIQHPELINFNFENSGVTNPDWIHLNAVSYNPLLDEILVSSRYNSEVWIIDHSTTTADAATHSGGNHGKGGDLLYRWGNPAAYNQGNSPDQQFFAQHAAHWIPQGLKDEGAIMVFNNGTYRPGGEYSSVDIIKPVTDSSGNYLMGTHQTFLPDSIFWTYKAPVPGDFYAMTTSGAQQLANGNTLICYGTKGTFFEIDSMKNIIWQYKCPVSGLGPVSQGSTALINNVFKSPLYEASYPGFANYTLTSGQPIELNPIPYICPAVTEINDNAISTQMLNIYPNPSTGNFFIENLTPGQNVELSISDVMGRMVYFEKIQAISGIHQVKCNLNKGLYLLYTQNGASCTIKKLVIE